MKDITPTEGIEIAVPSLSDITFKYTWQVKNYGKLKGSRDSFDSAPFEFNASGDVTRWNLSIRYWKGKGGKRLGSPVVTCLNLLHSEVRRPGQASVSFEFGVLNTRNNSWEVCPRGRTVLYLPSSCDILSVGYGDLHIHKQHMAKGTGTLSIFVKIRLSFTEEMEMGSLQQDLAQMLSEAEETGDVLVQCAQDKNIRAHSQILAARSPVFREMLLNGPNLDLANVTEDAAVQLLSYIYTDRVENLENTATVLLSNAHRFLLPGLKNTCEQYLSETITPTNIPSLLLVADQFDCEGLKRAVLNYCEDHAPTIQKNMTWKVLEMVNPELFEEACEAGLGSSVSSNIDSIPSDVDEMA